jgi:hypothetical protein
MISAFSPFFKVKPGKEKIIQGVNNSWYFISGSLR